MRKSENPKVSVCITTYNRRDYLGQTIASVLAQTYGDYEVVVVDDGSTDGTSEMIKDAGFDVRYYWVDHVGQSAARNRLIELAAGRYVTFIDSDDLLYPDSVQKLIDPIETHGPDVFVYGGYVGIDEEGREVKRRYRKPPSGRITTELFDFIHVHSCGTLCAKRMLEEVGGFDTTLRRCSVYKLLLDLSLKHRFIALDEPVFKRRRHGGNVSDCSFADRKIEYDVLEDFYFNGGGKDVIPYKRAMKRLAKEGYRAGRCAIREGIYDQAHQLLGLSFRRHPNIKSFVYWTRTMLKPR